MQALLAEALASVVFISWSAGVMTRFEYELYADKIAPDAYNARWWELVAQYQGIAPPEPRGEEFCDAATKTHVNNDPAQYYDYAIATVLLHQLHDHIARQILRQDPHRTNYYGSRATGDFLADLMSVGATRDWRELMRESLDTELDVRPMVEYFERLRVHLALENRGRKATLPRL